MKLWSPATVSLLAFTFFASHTGLEQSGPRATGAFFAVVTPNLKNATAWYTEKLGLKVAKPIPEANIVILEGEGLIVELQQPAGAPVRPAGSSTQGLMKVGFIVQDYEKALAELQIRKVEVAYGPYPAASGQRANVIIKDVDGNLIQLFGQ